MKKKRREKVKRREKWAVFMGAGETAVLAAGLVGSLARGYDWLCESEVWCVCFVWDRCLGLGVHCCLWVPWVGALTEVSNAKLSPRDESIDYDSLHINCDKLS